MKRCPECRRDYYDDSLLYCLEDGAALIQGSVPSPGEYETAIVGVSSGSNRPNANGDDGSESDHFDSEGLTQPQIHTTTGKSGGLKELSRKSPFLARPTVLMVAGLAVLVLIAGFFGYKYFSRSNSREIRSIAVMPFVNESGNADIEYLSDGMTDTLIGSLTKIPNLSVKSSSTVFYYKAKAMSPKQLGEELGVEAVLLGKITRRNDDVTIRLELVDTKTLNAIWSETYGQKVADLLTLQTQITRDVSKNLKSKLSSAEEEQLKKTDTSNSEAYQAYLKGIFELDHASDESQKRAIEFFNRAIELDPNYAKAWSGLADSYWGLGNASDWLPKVRSAAEKAVSLDPGSAEARESHANLLMGEWKFREAEEEFKSSISLNPDYSDAHASYSYLLLTLRRRDEAIKQAQQAVELQPLSFAANQNLALTLVRVGRTADGIAHVNKMLERFPDLPAPYSLLCNLLVNEGRFQEAMDADTKAIQLGWSRTGCKEKLVAKQGKKNELDELYRERPPRNELEEVFEAGRYSVLNAKDKAFEILEKLYSERVPYLYEISSCEDFDNLRTDPRLKDLLRRMNLPD